MADLEAGRVLGDRFEVVGVLGHGGMATVYLAQDRLRGEAVALKVLHGHLAKSAAWRSRLRREVNAASRLRHPNALVASDLHDLDGTLAVSMPLHPGRTLGEYVERQGPLTGPALERLARQLASVLREAHAAGLVHRDVTPTNVLVDDDGDAVLSDFGLARFADQRTATGTGVLGTAGYAAPEVYKGVRGDPRSDLYGLGAVLYQAATGAPPFAAPDPVGVLQKQLSDERVPLRQARSDLPAHLAGLVDRLLAVDAEARPQGAADVLEVLDRRVVPEPVAPRSAPEAARRHHLPPGAWTVDVRERRRDRMRRNEVRKWMERQRRADLGADIERAMGEVKRRVMGLMEIEPAQTAEERLSNAVAREAHLPPGALAVPYGMLERRFRLVEAVDQASATRLAKAARDEGFDAQPYRLGSQPPAAQAADVARTALRMGFLFVALVFGMIAAFAVSALAPWGDGLSVGWPWQGFPLLLFVFMLPAFARQRRASTPADDLPLAFASDLRFHLAPGANVTLPAPPSGPIPVEAAPPPPVAIPTSRHGAVIERTRAQLAALERSLGDSADRLPDAAVRDLKGTLRDLHERVEALGRRVLALEKEIGALDDTAAAAAVDRIEARLERLQTLSRVGRSDEDVEIPKLEHALAAHRRVLEQVESLEGQLTLAVARLLETGAAAAHARIELIEAPEPARSADDLLARLRQQTDGARRALDELEPAPRLPREPLPTAPRPDRPKIPDTA